MPSTSQAKFDQHSDHFDSFFNSLFIAIALVILVASAFENGQDDATPTSMSQEEDSHRPNEILLVAAAKKPKRDCEKTGEERNEIEEPITIFVPPPPAPPLVE